eukprot:TRINITY_DN13864_c0_g2_i1.p1 TRINITY_DN13864_c0_g2~~TRINITY_DN13864_c0_g2_i1.p1  ORF type:complete len:2083 (+),score=400.10 TRINITY_DN13864_c0_g2_i1:96-6251(+)
MILKLLLAVAAISNDNMIHFEGKSFDITSVPRVQTLSAGDGAAMREHLIKLEYPTRISLQQIKDAVNHHTLNQNPFAANWVKIAAKNTLVTHCSVNTATEIATFPGVQWVGTASEDHKKYLKIHSSIIEPNQHPREQTDTSKIVVTPHDQMMGDVLQILPKGAVLSFSGRRVAVSCIEVDCEEVAHTLASHDGLIEGVEHPAFQHVHNKFSRGLMQSGDWRSEPFSELTGEGHVVLVADTGIDHDHCFFRDDQVRTPIDVVNERHRKIVAYYSIGHGDGSHSDLDRSGDGHGTHVAGSVAGSLPAGVENDKSAYQGLVRDAKLVFVDIAVSEGDGVQPPYDLTAGIFRRGKQSGVHIHTNSWGSYGGSYGSQCKDVDSYSTEQPSDLIFFAAGNEADKACKSNPLSQFCDKGTVISPCIAKNNVCVGASMAPLESWEEMGLNNYYINFTAANSTEVMYMLTKGYFGEKHPDLWTGVELVMAKPEDACSAQSTPGQGRLDNPQEIAGKVAIVMRGTCYFETKVKLLESAGAVGIIVVNNIPGDPIVMGAEKIPKSEFKVPAFMVSDIGGEQLISILSQEKPTADIYVDDKLLNTHKSPGDLAEFSSRGPTVDYRFKPDVVGVGYYVHSARSDSDLASNNCDLAAEMGTSMATPIVAATSVQIRQWLMAKGVKPTGALLKAFLIQAAVPLSGIVDRNAQGDWLLLEQTPDFYQGHGRVQLNTTLASPADLSYEMEGEFAQNGESKEFCYRQSTNGDFNKYGFRASLVWMDAPVGGNALHQLVNDLDLEVMTPAGDVYMGNAHGSPNNHVRDVLNNVEKVIAPSSPGEVFRVTVKASNIVSNQDFALVASGEKVDCQTIPKPNCKSGSACGHVQALENGGDRNLYTGHEVLKVLGWRLFKVTAQKAMTKLKVEVKKVGVGKELDANPDIYIRKGSLPDLYSFDTRSNNMCGTESQCASQNTKAVQVETVGDTAIYYIGIFMRCCRDAHVEISVQYETEGDNLPQITSISSGSQSVNNALGKSMFITPTVFFKGAHLVIRGKYFGDGDKTRLVSLVTHSFDDDTATSVLLCDLTDVSSTKMTCNLPPGYALIDKSPLSITIDGLTVVSKAVISFGKVLKSRYNFNGIRPCISSECTSTRSQIYFDHHLSQKGGDLFVAGSNFGDRNMQGENAIDIFIGDDDNGWRKCIKHPYEKPGLVKCSTPQGMSGTKNIKASIYGIDLGVFEATLFFEPPPAVTGVSKTSDGSPVQTLLLGYSEAVGKTIWLHGSYLGNPTDDIIRGMSQENGFGDNEVKVTLGELPGANDLNCAVKHPDSSPKKISCVLPDEVDVSLRDTLLYIKIVKYDVEVVAEASIMVLNPPMLTGISTSTLLQGSTHLTLPHTVLSSGGQQLILWGRNFPDDMSYSCQFTNSMMEVIGSSTTRYQSDGMLEVDLMLWNRPMDDHESIEITLKVIHMGSEEIQAESPLTITIAPKPFINKVTIVSQTDTSLQLRIDGSMVMQSDPFVLVGSFACLVKDGDLHDDYLLCEAVPVEKGTFSVTVYFAGHPAENESPTEIVVEKGGPITQWTKAVPPSHSILLGEQSLTVPPTEGIDHFAITATSCGKVMLLQGETTYFDSSVSVTVDRGLNYTICWGSDSHPGLWFPTTPGRVSHADLTTVSLHGEHEWSHAVDYNTPSSHIKLGHLPEAEVLKFSLLGENIPFGSVLRLFPGTGGCSSESIATFTARATSTLSSVDYEGGFPGDASFRDYSLCLHAGTAEDYFLGIVSAVACKESDKSSCNKHGTCIDNECQCFNSYKGFKCELECPLNPKTGDPCSKNGICTDEAQCRCFPQRYGSTCDIEGKETEIQNKYVGEVGKTTWQLYHLVAPHSETFLDVEWFNRNGIIDVLIWDDPNKVGLPEHVVSHYVMSEPYAADKALRLTLKLTADFQEKDSYIGLYGSLIDSDDLLSFDLYITDGTPFSEELTPAPLVNQFNEFSRDYEGVAAVAGGAIGILLVCCVCLLWKYVCGPFYRVFLAKAPVELEEMDEFDDFEANNDMAVRPTTATRQELVIDEEEEHT